MARRGVRAVVGTADFVGEAPSGIPRPGAQGLGSLSMAAGLEAGLRCRAPGIHESTPMVRGLAVRVSAALGLDEDEQALVDLCARVRDVGMLALPDSVVLSTGTLQSADWELVNRHPVLGADLLASLPGLEQTAPVVRGHHERWDGGGYPDGLSGRAIPLLSRVIATCDAFVAMASDRPHRRGAGAEVAIEHLVQERERQFDPQVVDALVGVLTGAHEAKERTAREPGRSRTPPTQSGSRAVLTTDLAARLASFEVLPAFGPAIDRLIAIIDSGRTGSAGDAVSAIESDTGLTVAVLRAAQTAATRRPVSNVGDAVAALGDDELRQVAGSLPRAAFPWRSPLEAQMHRLRVHGQAVSRAAQRIAYELDFRQADDLLAVALLHDVGKLVLASGPGVLSPAQEASTAPETRIRDERRSGGLDHASLGSLLLERWGLPRRLREAVSAHHTAEGAGELATLVRLADLIAHQAHGDQVDRKVMLRLAGICGLPTPSLRDALFDLPRVGGSERRRADPSPLSARETIVLRRLAEGKLYKQIAAELDLSMSTIRSHLHNVYMKLEVADRAQAVLRATEMGWI